MASKGHSIANAQGFFLKHEAETETEMELKVYVAEKMEIVGDFFDKKHQPSDEELEDLKEKMLNKKSTRGIDDCFRDFINSKN